MKEAAVCLIEYDNKFLFLDRATWPLGMGLPGGKLELNELPEDAVLREVLEETGIVLDKHCLIYTDVCTTAISLKTVYLYYIYLHEEPTVTIQSSEALGYKWVELKDLYAQRLAGNTSDFLDIYIEQELLPLYHVSKT